MYPVISAIGLIVGPFSLSALVLFVAGALQRLIAVSLYNYIIRFNYRVILHFKMRLFKVKG
jgi:hypothetical protein